MKAYGLLSGNATGSVSHRAGLLRLWNFLEVGGDLVRAPDIFLIALIRPKRGK
jgi:hypothetical protein